MQTVTYPNGQVLTTTELTIQQINLVFRALTMQMLGISPGTITTLTTVSSSTGALVSSGSEIAQGQVIVAAGVPISATVAGITGSVITLSKAATASGAVTASFGADAGAFDAVRLDWPTEGQPGFIIANDYCFLRCVERDDPYNRVRENGTLAVVDEHTFSQETTWTRCWDVTWELWGPHATERGSWLRDGIQSDWTADVLVGSNLFAIPDIPRVERVPQNFQDQWWETAYLTCEFNEFVTQTLTTPAGASVELIVSDPSGVLVDKTFNLGA